MDKSDDENKNTLFSTSLYNDQPVDNEQEVGAGNNSTYLSVPSNDCQKHHKKTNEETKKVEYDLINVKNMLEDNILDVYQKKKSEKSPFLNGQI